MARETFFNSDGTVDHTVDDGAPEPVQSLYLQLLATDPDRANAVIALADGLIDKAGDLWSALEAISIQNTARPAIDIIVDTVVTAAEPLIEDP